MFSIIKFKGWKKTADNCLIVSFVLYLFVYLFLSLNGEYRGPVASGKTKLFDWGWNAGDTYLWQPKFLYLKPNNWNYGGLIFSPLIGVDRLIWHKNVHADTPRP